VQVSDSEPPAVKLRCLVSADRHPDRRPRASPHSRAQRQSCAPRRLHTRGDGETDTFFSWVLFGPSAALRFGSLAQFGCSRISRTGTDPFCLEPACPLVAATLPSTLTFHASPHPLETFVADSRPTAFPDTCSIEPLLLPATATLLNAAQP